MAKPSKESQARLFSVAETQGGFFTAKQAEAAGFDSAHHAYHVRAGNWKRAHRGVYRLALFPLPERSDLILWSLWSRNRDDEPQGVYSHQTALSLYDLSDLMPEKLHLTVPRTFRRQAAIPAALVLHYDDLPAAEIDEREGYRVTRVVRALIDVSRCSEVSEDFVVQAFDEARARGLLTGRDIARYRDRLPTYLLAERTATV